MTIDLNITWCRQLIVEFSRIVYSRKISLECPNFKISSATRQFGCWSSLERSITISERLIKEHTWDVVLEVLKHEMAHQYVTEVLKDTDSKAHSEVFQKACVILGVHPDYCGAGGRHPKFMLTEGADLEKEAHLKKIEKLLALAGSANEHEAALAMEKANAIIAKYNLEFVFNSLEAEYDYAHVNTGKKKMSIWTKGICGILRDHFFVKIITVTSYDAEKCCGYKAIEMVGDKNNLAIAEYVFYFLSERLETLWENYRQETSAKPAEKRSFCMGVIHGFKKKLDAADRAKHESILANTGHETTSALVVAQDHKLAAFYAERYPCRRNTRTKSSKIQSGAYNSGIGEGTKITVNKPLSAADGNKGKFLTR